MLNEIKKNIKEVKEAMLVLILFIWLIIPVLKELKATYLIASENEYIFILFVGFIGLICLFLEIFSKLRNIKDKKQYIKEMLPIILLTIFMIWTFICSLCADNIQNAIWGSWYRKEGYMTYLGYAGFFSCAYLIKSPNNKKLLINTLVIASILNILMVELCNKGILTNIFVKRNITTTFFYQFNHMGYYLLISTVSSIFLCITEKKKIIKILYLLASIFLAYYLVLNNTFGCFVALIGTLIFFTIYYICSRKISKKTMAIIGVTIILIVMLVFCIQPIRKVLQKNFKELAKDVEKIIDVLKISEDTKNKELLHLRLESVGTFRMKLWINGVNVFLQRPILGYGPDNLKPIFDKLNVNQDRPHNLFINLGITSGIIGLVTYVSAILIIMIRGIKRVKNGTDIHIVALAIVVAYFISAMFANSMYYISPYFFIFLGMLMYENINFKEIKE